MSDQLSARSSLRNAPKIAGEIGQLCVIWAAVEYNIFRIFCLLTDLPIPLARAIFYSQRTTRTRIDAVFAVAPIILRKIKGTGTTADLKRLRSMLGRIGNLAGERNKYVHDTWGSTSESSPRAFQFRLSGNELHGRYQRVTKADISGLIERIETQRMALSRFASRIAPKMPALHEKLGKPPVLVLEFSTKDIRPRRKQVKRPRRPAPLKA